MVENAAKRGGRERRCELRETVHLPRRKCHTRAVVLRGVCGTVLVGVGARLGDVSIKNLSVCVRSGCVSVRVVSLVTRVLSALPRAWPSWVRVRL